MVKITSLLLYYFCHQFTISDPNIFVVYHLISYFSTKILRLAAMLNPTICSSMLSFIVNIVSYLPYYYQNTLSVPTASVVHLFYITHIA